MDPFIFPTFFVLEVLFKLFRRENRVTPYLLGLRGRRRLELGQRARPVSRQSVKDENLGMIETVKGEPSQTRAKSPHTRRVGNRCPVGLGTPAGLGIGAPAGLGFRKLGWVGQDRPIIAQFTNNRHHHPEILVLYRPVHVFLRILFSAMVPGFL